MLFKNLVGQKPVKQKLLNMLHDGRVADYKNSTLTYDRYFTTLTYTGLLTISSLDKLNGK